MAGSGSVTTATSVMGLHRSPMHTQPPLVATRQRRADSSALSSPDRRDRDRGRANESLCRRSRSRSRPAHLRPARAARSEARDLQQAGDRHGPHLERAHRARSARSADRAESCSPRPPLQRTNLAGADVARSASTGRRDQRLRSGRSSPWPGYSAPRCSRSHRCAPGRTVTSEPARRRPDSAQNPSSTSAAAALRGAGSAFRRS